MAGPNLGIGDLQNSPFGERMCVTSQENAANQGSAPGRSARAGHSKGVPEERRKNGFCNKDNHKDEKGKLPPLIQRCAASKIKIIGMLVGGGYSMRSYNRCRELYLAAGGELSEIKPFGSSSDLASQFMDQIFKVVLSAAPKTPK
jgi:hypothetical protein